MIEMENRDPPTLSIKDRDKLAVEFKKADLLQYNKKEKVRIIPEYPCIHELTEGRQNGINSIPILVLIGRKGKPQMALFIPPTEQVTEIHDGVPQIYANLAALFLKKCTANDIKVKVKYEDEPGSSYIVSHDHIRVYQCLVTCSKDVPCINNSNWMCGYAFKPQDPSKPKTPALTKHWQNFPLCKPPDVDECGDLIMWHSGNNEIYEVAFNEIGAVKYQSRLHDDWNMPPPLLWEMWRELLEDLVPFATWLQHHKIPVFPIASPC